MMQAGFRFRTGLRAKAAKKAAAPRSNADILAACVRPRIAVPVQPARVATRHVYEADTNSAASRPTKKPKKQSITVAVDGSDNSVQGLAWTLKTFADTDSVLNVIHVVNNDRVTPVSLGTNGNNGSLLKISFDEDFSEQPLADYVDRKVAAAQEMIAEKYLPALEAAGMHYNVNVHVVDGQRSAAGIAEAVVQAATASKSDLLAVTSHGGGLHCSYGSVARYCTQHFNRAIVLLPPDMDSFAARDSPVVCVGVNTLSELQDSMTWALRSFCRSGDSVSVLRAAEETMTGRAAGSDQTSIMLGLQEQIMKHHIDDISFDLIQPDFSAAATSVDPENSSEPPLNNQITADELLRVAEKKEARALVMTNYAAKGFLQEMMFGTLALLASRKTPLPLLLIPPGSSFE